MEEEVQGGPARERGRVGRGTRGRGRCVNRRRGIDGLEDAADRGGHGHGNGHGRGSGRGRGRGHRCGRVNVDAFEDGDDYHELLALLGIPYQTA